MESVNVQAIGHADGWARQPALYFPPASFSTGQLFAGLLFAACPPPPPGTPTSTPGRIARQAIGTVYPRVPADSDQGGVMKGFRTFLLRGNLVDLAVAVVVGVAFNAVVQSLVANIITPLIAAIASKPNFGSLTVHIGSADFTYGLFLNALISFLIIAAVVYFLVVAPVAKLLAFVDRKKEATERDCPECLSQIPIAAKRCKFCTAVIPPASAKTSS